MTDPLPALSCSLIRVLSPPLTQQLRGVLEVEPAGRRQRLPGEELHTARGGAEIEKYGLYPAKPGWIVTERKNGNFSSTTQTG